MSKYISGQSGNPLGRPRGIRDSRSEIRRCLESNSEELIAEAVRRAMNGSDALLAVLINRLLPPPRSESVGDIVEVPRVTLVRWDNSSN